MKQKLRLTVVFSLKQSLHSSRNLRNLWLRYSHAEPDYFVLDYLSESSNSAWISLLLSENHGHQKRREEKKKNLAVARMKGSPRKKNEHMLQFFKLNPYQIAFIVVQVVSSIFFKVLHLQ